MVNNNQLEELLDETPFRVLPMMHYTGRPDFAIQSLIEGRFLILIDGSPIALIGPVNLPFLLKLVKITNILGSLIHLNGYYVLSV
nr:spore germination protein [Piscibacillus salipiscarius]